jgi:hypothetical protein
MPTKTRSTEPLYALPEVTAIDNRAKRAEVIVLLGELRALKEATKDVDEKKKRLAELLREDGLTEGVRFGRTCATLRYQAGRKSFDRERAIDAGITPDQIERAMREGKSFTVVTLDEISDGDDDE